MANGKFNRIDSLKTIILDKSNYYVGREKKARQTSIIIRVQLDLVCGKKSIVVDPVFVTLQDKDQKTKFVAAVKSVLFYKIYKGKNSHFFSDTLFNTFILKQFFSQNWISVCNSRPQQLNANSPTNIT